MTWRYYEKNPEGKDEDEDEDRDSRLSAILARKRAYANPSANEKPHQSKSLSTDAPPIAPPKTGLIFKLILFFSVPYLYLIFYHYKIDLELRRSLVINAGLCLAGFFVTLPMIPVACRYVIRPNLFGYDINKRGTPQGAVKVGLLSTMQPRNLYAL